MAEFFIPSFVQTVAKGLSQEKLDVVTKWTTGSLEDQDARALAYSGAVDLVIGNVELGAVAAEFKQGPLTSVEVASVVRHFEIMRGKNPKLKYALVAIDPVEPRVSEMLKMKDVQLVEGADAQHVVFELSRIAKPPKP